MPGSRCVDGLEKPNLFAVFVFHNWFCGYFQNLLEFHWIHSSLSHEMLPLATMLDPPSCLKDSSAQFQHGSILSWDFRSKEWIWSYFFFLLLLHSCSVCPHNAAAAYDGNRQILGCWGYLQHRKLQPFAHTASGGDSDLQSRVCSLQETGHDWTVKLVSIQNLKWVSRWGALHVYSQSEAPIFVTPS